MKLIKVRSVLLLCVFIPDTLTTTLDKGAPCTSDDNLWQTTRKARYHHLQNMSHRGDVVKQVSLYSTTPQGCHRHTYGHRYADLKGQILRVGVIPWPERLHYNASTSAYSGYNLDLIAEIAKLLNFRFSFIQPEDGQWGNFKNNTWNGLVRMLVNQELDIALSLASTPERAQSIDFACHMYESELKLWMLDPKLDHEIVVNVFDLLTSSVTWCLLSSFLVIVVVYSLSSALLSHSSEPGLHFLQRFYENCFFYARPLLRQGTLNHPFSTTGRLLLSFWWWFSIILSITYTGTIIASLADTRIFFPFTTVTGMLHQDVYKWGYVGNSSIQSFIDGSKQHHVQQIRAAVETFAKSDPAVVGSDIFLHYNKMTTEKYLYIGTIVNPAATNFVSLRETIHLQQSCVGLPRNSILTSAFQTALTDLDSFGILYKLAKNNRLLPRQPKSPESVTQPKVTLHLVQSVFYVTACGIVLSGGILVLEFLHRFNQPLCLRQVCTEEIH